MPDRRPLPRLHLVTDDSVLGERAFVEAALEALRAGGPEVALHLRGPRTGGLPLFRLARRLVAACHDSGAALVVNDRVDVAMAVGADAVQLGARSLPAADARSLLGDGPRIGISVHSVAEGEGAVRSGADFLLAGTLFASGSHPGRGGAGTGWLAPLARLGAPVIGIGGVTPERAREVIGGGAHGVAVLGGVWRTPSPAAAVETYIEALGNDRTV